METSSLYESIVNWIPVVSAVAALIALLLSLISFRTAKKAYLLALKQDLRQQPSLELYIADSYICPSTPPIPRLFVFLIKITNTSDAGNSIRELELFIERGKEREITSTVAIPHDSSFFNHLKHKKQEPFKIPISISSRTVIQGLAIFPVVDDLTKNTLIEGYIVKATDSFGHKTEREAILLKEVNNEKGSNLSQK